MIDPAPPLFAAELLKATGGKPLRGGDGWSCSGISTDTRTLSAGNLFIALSGDHFDGHDWLAMAAERGAAGLLIRSDAADRIAPLPGELPVIAVSDTLTALGDIARYWRQRFPIPVVAITGSSGKTTTKEMVATILSRTRATLKTEGNLNNQIGLPQTLLRLRQSHQIAVVEMGMNTPGEIAKLTAIALPDVGLITNIGPAHIERLGSLDAIREEKGALFAVMAGRGVAILNRDDPAIGLLAKRWRGKGVTFGRSPDAEVTARGVAAANAEGTRFDLVIAGAATPAFLAAAGEHNVTNALAAAAAAWALGLDRDAIAAGLARFRPVPGRSEIRQLPNGAHLIIDTYNANPASVAEALKTLRALSGNGKAVVILGDMLELGERSEEWHANIGALVAEQPIDRLFLKGELTRALAEGARRAGMAAERIRFFDDPAEVVSVLRPHLGKGDWVLIKGSRKMKMELVAEKILAAFDLKPQTV